MTVATKTKTAPKSTKTKAKAAKKQAPKAKKPAAKSKKTVSIQPVKVKAKARPADYVPTKREFLRGQSPYSSPQPGQTVRNSEEVTRQVLSCSDNLVTFAMVASDGTLGAERTVTRNSWAQWCSRTKAKILPATGFSEPKAEDPPADESHPEALS